MSQDCCELPVCTETQQLSRDHWDHQHGFNTVKQNKMKVESSPDLKVCLQRALKQEHTEAKDAFLLEITVS